MIFLLAWKEIQSCDKKLARRRIAAVALTDTSAIHNPFLNVIHEQHTDVDGTGGRG